MVSPCANVCSPRPIGQEAKAVGTRSRVSRLNGVGESLQGSHTYPRRANGRSHDRTNRKVLAEWLKSLQYQTCAGQSLCTLLLVAFVYSTTCYFKGNCSAQ